MLALHWTYYLCNLIVILKEIALCVWQKKHQYFVIIQMQLGNSIWVCRHIRHFGKILFCKSLKEIFKRSTVAKNHPFDEFWTLNLQILMCLLTPKTLLNLYWLIKKYSTSIFRLWFKVRSFDFFVCWKSNTGGLLSFNCDFGYVRLKIGLFKETTMSAA